MTKERDMKTQTVATAEQIAMPHLAAFGALMLKRCEDQVSSENKADSYNIEQPCLFDNWLAESAPEAASGDA